VRRRRVRSNLLHVATTGLGRLSVIGVPNSLASYAAGQELAPAALREAGLIPRLEQAGLDVVDEGDLPLQVWRPDREHPLAQHADAVAACLSELTTRLRPLVSAGHAVLVIGGNCTIALAAVAALGTDDGPPGLLYVDRGFDLNTPATTTDGALDWMGMAHALALPGCVEAVLAAFDRRPLLQPDQVAWLGVQTDLATQGEREQAAHLRLQVATSDELASAPEDAAREALAALPTGPLAIHLDVDVLDFTDAPLAENTDGRNTGPSLAQAGVALSVAASDPRARVLTVGELNPTRSVGDPSAIPRFVAKLVEVAAELATAG
jgi:arginase